jgi:cell division inhibitor SulA
LREGLSEQGVGVPRETVAAPCERLRVSYPVAHVIGWIAHRLRRDRAYAISDAASGSADSQTRFIAAVRLLTIGAHEAASRGPAAASPHCEDIANRKVA